MEDGKLEFAFTKSEDVAIVTIPGDHLDTSNAGAFKTAIAPILESNKKVVFDLSQLEFVDSSGLGSILSCLRQLNANGGDLRLCRMTKPVRVLFELVRMHRVFEIHDTREEAVAAF
jgi:anti-sigma B factor antagonist